MQIVPGTVTHILVYGQTTGSITACTVTDSPGPFTYAWDDGSRDSDRIAIPAGTYTLTVTDVTTGETVEHTYQVSQNDPITVVTPGTVTDAAFDIPSGSIGPPVVSGGGGTYIYSWRDWLAHDDPTRSNLAPGTYVLIIDDTYGGATVLQSYEVGQYEPLAISVAGTVKHIKVKGQTTGEIGPSTFTGGSTDYIVSWSDDSQITTSERSNLGAGEYVMILNDGSGSTEQRHSFTVEENGQIEVTSPGVVSPSMAQAQGSIGMPMVKGGNGLYVFSWDDNVAVSDGYRTGLADGEYKLFITDTDGAEPCEVNYTVPAYSALRVTPGHIRHSLGLGENNGIIFASTLSGGSGNFQFQWSDLAEPSTSTFRSDLAYGHYTLQVTDVGDGGKYAEVHFTVKQFKKPPPKRAAHRLRIPGP
jgi:hypothetical protein